MIGRASLIAIVSFALACCGVKSDLLPPMGQVMQQEKDPSKPPTPLGQPGGTTPPYTTGP